MRNNYYYLPYDNDGSWNTFLKNNVDQQIDILSGGILDSIPELPIQIQVSVIATLWSVKEVAHDVAFLHDNYDNMMNNEATLTEQLNDPKTWMIHDFDQSNPLFDDGAGYDTGIGDGG